ncbi:unnamed protein product [Laminaria digitata]
MRLLKVLPGILLAPSCDAFSVRSSFAKTTTDCRQQSPSRAAAAAGPVAVRPRRRSHQTNNMNLSNDNTNSDVPEVLRLANLKAHEEVWQSRRGMARATLSAAKALQGARGSLAGHPDASEEGNLAADGKGALVVSAVGLAVAAATLRVGGRAALISALGLDFAEDLGVKDNLDSFLAFFGDLGPIRYGYFLGGWVVAKTFCLDFLSIVLALGSGVVFGGVVQGALMSTLCATIASGLGFQLARTTLQSQVEEQLEKRPALRALEKVVSEEGFKTVVTLRLAPVLPIPLGAYNYVYGATSLKLPVFLSGMFVGSLKPYLLDSCELLVLSFICCVA